MADASCMTMGDLPLNREICGLDASRMRDAFLIEQGMIIGAELKAAEMEKEE